MKIAIISDVHGNLYALKEVFVKIRSLGCDEIWCLGDNFGYFPDGNICFDLVQKNCKIVLMGNHEAMLLGEIKYSSKAEEVYKLNHSKELMDSRTHSEISKLPRNFIKVIENATRIYLSHGSPFDNLKGYLYPWDDLQNIVNSLVEKFPKMNLFAVGNTHRPFIHREKRGTILNVGSVGLPRDIGSKGSFGVLTIDSAKISVGIERFDLPIDLILEKYSKKVHPSVVKMLLR